MKTSSMVRYAGLACFGWLTFISPLCATTIVTYTFATATGDPSGVATDFITANTATLGYTSSGNFGFSSSTNSLTGTAGSFFSRLSNNGATWTAPTSLSAATSAGTYLDFSVTPVNGAILDLTSLSIDVFAQTLSGGTTYGDYTAYYNLKATTNGVTSDLGTVSYSTTITFQGAKTYDTQNLAFDLTSLADVNSSTTFRLTLYVVGESNYFETIRVDNIYLNATAIPEPRTILYILLGLACFAFYAWHKFRPCQFRAF